MQNTRIMQSVCDAAGLPMEPSKSVGPNTQLVFLGMIVDATKGKLCLPQEKLSQLQDTLGQWRGRKACRKRELLSLIGSLSHACKVMRVGRIFLRILIDLSTKADRLNHFICLNTEARADIEWWHQLIGPWNGTSLLATLATQSPATTIYSDATGMWGCGAVCGVNWFQVKCGCKSQVLSHINQKTHPNSYSGSHLGTSLLW